MTYYCIACKRATAPYDLWPNGECCACYTAFEDVMDRDHIMDIAFYLSDPLPGVPIHLA